MDIIEYNSISALMILVDEINAGDEAGWGIVCIKRHYLKSMTNEAFLLAIKPAVIEAKNPKVFFVDNKKVYITWCGNQKTVYRHLRSYIATTMLQPGYAIEPTKILGYYDPCVHADELKSILKTDKKEQIATTAHKAEAGSSDPFGGDEDDDEGPALTGEPTQSIKATPAQAEHYHQIRSQKPYRKQLHILVVEDQIFSQKLLCEILRGARTGGRDAPVIDATQGMQEAWKIFLKKAPDVSFIDLGLGDGSGHSLARAIKEIDPTAQVIIVTANNVEEELGVARQNNVDAFIAKPYNKKQILDCVDKYVNEVKVFAKGGARGFS